MGANVFGELDSAMRGYPKWGVSLLVALATSAWVNGAEAQSDEPDSTPGYPERVVQWTVQEGETCAHIATALYGSAHQVPLIERYNDVDCRRGLRAGHTLVVPEHPSTQPPARLQSFKPYTQARPPGGGWNPVTQGMALIRNYSVNTLSGARADIVFRDATIMALGENTLVVIYDTARESLVARTAPQVQLDEGELRAGLAALRGEPPRVAVMGGTVTASSRDTVVRTQPQRTTVSVFDGSARVESAGKTVNVHARHGTSFEPARPPSAPHPLPPAPRWATHATRGVTLSEPHGGVVVAAWHAVPQAVTYRVELARDPEFETLLLRREVPAKVHTFRVENLDAGRYFVRVRAIDEDDFLGLAANDLEVLIIEVRFVGAGGQIRGSEIVASPYSTLILNDPQAAQLALDQSSFAAAPRHLDLATHRPRTLRWRLREGASTTRHAVRYVVPEITLAVFPMGRGRTRITLEFGSLAGADLDETVRPRLRLHLPQGTHEVPIVTMPKGIPEATVTTGTARVARIDVVDGRGHLLGTGTFDLRSGEPIAEVPQVVVASDTVLGVTAPPIPSSPATSVEWWAPTRHNSGTVTAAAQASRDQVGGQVQARIAGQRDRFGVDVRIVSDDLGDLSPTDSAAWLGLRWSAVENAGLQLGPALRLGVPTSSPSPRSRVDIGVAAAGHRDFTWIVNGGARTALDSNQDRDPTPRAQGYVLGGLVYDANDWLRGYAVLDAHLLRNRELHGRSGLAVGAEAGRLYFGGIGLRYAPWDSGGGRALLQASVGVRR